MQITAHRGYWINAIEKNTMHAFEKAFANGFGIEFDIRDFDGKLVVSHDMPKKENLLYLEEVLELLKKINPKLLLQCNLKADGISKLLCEMMQKFELENFVLFDMSIPETILCARNNMPFYSRVSDYENEAILIDKAVGIWLDAFEGDWYEMNIIHQFINKNKSVAIVSPELHKRPHIEFWNTLKIQNFHNNNNVVLCTDFPMEAQAFFK